MAEDKELVAVFVANLNTAKGKDGEATDDRSRA
jgi:hypothetical protein